MLYEVITIEENELGGNATFSSLFTTAIAFPSLDEGGDDILSIDTDSVIVLPNTATFKDAVKSVSFTQLDEFYHGSNTIGKVQYTYNGAVVGSAVITSYSIHYTKLYEDRPYSPASCLQKQRHSSGSHQRYK